MRRNSIFRPILWVLLLVGGFFAGSAWNNRFHSDAPPRPQVSSEETPYNSNEDATAVPAKMTPPAGLTEAEKAIIRLFENAAPSVCFITTSRYQQDIWSQNVMEIPQGSGSGFVWNTQGHIITNFHVIQSADRAQVTLADHSTWDAEVIGTAPDKDLAVLKIEAPAKSLKPIQVGASENLLVGQAVFAIGNPFGLDQSLTTGIISALGREIQSVSGIPIRDVIQSDAAINPGNSGGPLLNSSGQLIGVNTAIYSPSGASAGIGFSIPVDVVKWVVPELIQHGQIMRPTLGVNLASAQATKQLNLEGALILSVVKGSAADRAGLQSTYRDRAGRIRYGDLITAVNGDKVESSNDLILALEKYKAGDTVKLKVKRGNQEQEVSVQLDAARKR
ncbi:MAG: trypsin-like peptidase domain-containing protein [Bacteroidota bacterium]